MLKILIIIFISILAFIDVISIFGPEVKKFKRKQQRKAFKKKMEELEIKWMNLIYIAVFKKCLTKNCIEWGIYNERKNIKTLF